MTGFVAYIGILMNKQQANLVIQSAPVWWKYYDPQENLFYTWCKQWYCFDEHWKRCSPSEDVLDRRVRCDKVLAIAIAEVVAK